MVMTSVSGHLLTLEFLPAYRSWSVPSVNQSITTANVDFEEVGVVKVCVVMACTKKIDFGRQ